MIIFAHGNLKEFRSGRYRYHYHRLQNYKKLIT